MLRNLAVLRRRQAKRETLPADSLVYAWPFMREVAVNYTRLLRARGKGRFYLVVFKVCDRRLPGFRLGVFDQYGAGAGGGDTRALLTNGTIVTQLGGATHSRHATDVSALAPDGVVSVRLVFKGFTRTVPVSSNWWTTRVRFPPPKALPRRTIWLDRKGESIKTFKSP